MSLPLSAETPPPARRWHWLPMLLVGSGAILVLVAAVATHNTLGGWQWVIYVGVVLTLAAVGTFWRQLSTAEIELDADRQKLGAEASQLTTQREELATLRSSWESAWQAETAQLTSRKQALAERFLTYHEWTEFPQPQSLSSASNHLPDPAAFKDLATLAEKDRQLLELLKQETQSLYERITSNRYVVEGKFQPMLARDDAFDLMHRVAQLYQPGVEQPILATNVELVLRAASRASLQLLTLLDDLPVNVKDHSFTSLYAYVRQAVKAYTAYKATEPYWPYVNTAYYLGRFAMGAHPLSLGAWWFAGSLSKQGAKALANHLVNRQALALLGNLVRVIGFEVAGMYGGDFRHRDANWIYAAELSELLTAFPLSRESLAHGLTEMGSLQLRSEYDRVFLYRCVAAQRSARPEQYQAATVLTMEERRAIASRLEKFLSLYIHGKASERVGKWKQGVEQRLGLKLQVQVQATNQTVQAQVTDALRSLASFLIGTKECEPTELASLLPTTLLYAELSPNEATNLLTQLEANPPFFFEHPDLDPESDLATKYLDDLAKLHVATRPRDVGLETALEDSAIYLRKQPKLMRGMLEKQFANAIAARLHPDCATKKFPVNVARGILDLLEPADQVRFAYSGITLEKPTAGSPEPTGPLWLVGAGERIILASLGEQPQVLWLASETSSTEMLRGYLSSSLRLSGGNWLPDSNLPAGTAIVIAGAVVSTYASYFGPLLTLLKK